MRATTTRVERRAPDPKLVDQPEFFPSGAPTQGKFNQAAQAAKAGSRPPERVRVYEKIRPGIWAYNGMFHLVDSWQESDRHRRVFKFRLAAVEGEEDLTTPTPAAPTRRRIVPTAVKLELWKRDGGFWDPCRRVRRAILSTIPGEPLRDIQKEP